MCRLITLFILFVFGSLSCVQAQTCNPPKNTMVNSVTTNSATVSWDGVTNRQNYRVRHRLAGDTAWVTQTTQDTFLTLSGLEVGKAYEVKVRTACGGGNLSPFAKSIVFNTSSVWNQTATGNLYLANPNAQIGIGTLSPMARIHGVGSLVMEGNTGSTPLSGAGTRLEWIAGKSALRAGTVSASQWDDVVIGVGSVAMGENTIASGMNSFAFGKGTEATGKNAFAYGYNVKATAHNSMAFGYGGMTGAINNTPNSIKFFFGANPVLTIDPIIIDDGQPNPCQFSYLDEEGNPVNQARLEVNRLHVKSFSVGPNPGPNNQECGGDACFDTWVGARYFKASQTYYLGLDCSQNITDETLRLTYIDQVPTPSISIGTVVPAMQVYKNGRVAIGNTTAPNALFQVGDIANPNNFQVAIQANELELGGRSIYTNGAIQIIRKHNSYAPAFNVEVDDSLTQTTVTTRAYTIESRVEGIMKHRFTAWGDGAMTWNTALPGSAMINCQDETGKKLFYVGKNGNVGIGTDNPLAKLTVDGLVCMKEGWVKLNGAPCWPDYVFEKGYPLPTLDSVEHYLKVNKHLPEVPTAKEVESNGFQIGATQRAMLKNMEEMYLQMIELNKRVKALETENKQLKAKIREE